MQLDDLVPSTALFPTNVQSFSVAVHCWWWWWWSSWNKRGQQLKAKGVHVWLDWTHALAPTPCSDLSSCVGLLNRKKMETDFLLRRLLFLLLLVCYFLFLCPFFLAVEKPFKMSLSWLNGCTILLLQPFSSSSLCTDSFLYTNCLDGQCLFSVPSTIFLAA